METTEGLERLGELGPLSLEKRMLRGISSTGINIQWGGQSQTYVKFDWGQDKSTN